ncbi:MAG: ABC transporter substrate-binding protein [Sphaerochaeta sp.]|uniref:ABC transporter substrate-binding protein n=1 Tax=Sphaerochaeta sp. TaxID=1972642 RepID=UPI003D10088A
MKKVSILALVVLLLGSMVFAAGSKEEATQGPKVLKVMLSEEPSSEDALLNTMKDWAAETGNTLDVMVIPYEDQLTKFPLMARNNDLPDLIATTRLARLYPDEFIDLSEYFDMSIFEPMAVEIIVQDYKSDKKSTLPQQFTITNVYYNKDAFDRVGLSAPTVEDPWTFEELEKNAKLLKEKGGVKYGMAMDSSRARYDNLMYANGGSMVEKSGDSFVVAINSPQNIATLEAFVDWNNSFMPKAIWAGGTTDNPADYFKNGDVGIYFSGTWNYNSFYNQIEDMNWGVMPSPVGPEGPSAILGGSGLGVPVNAKNKDLAVDFLKWFYTEENFQTYLNRDKGLSSLVGVTYSPADQQVAEDYKVLQSEVSKVSYAFSVDESSMWRNFYDNEYRDALRQAVNGDISPAKALNDFAELLSKKSGWPLKY